MLGALGLVGGLILSAVFATAGIAKLADLAGTRTAVREFGAPRAFVGPLALVLPLAELAVAFILLPGPTRVPGGSWRAGAARHLLRRDRGEPRSR